MSGDRLLGGRVVLRQPERGLRAGLDAVMLAAAVPAHPGETVLEAGTGTGAAILCLMARVPALTGIAVERDPELAELARANAAANRAALTVIEGDIADRRIRDGLPRCHHAFANPPYWPGGTRPPEALRAAATHADRVPLGAWAAFCAAPLGHRGSVTLILPAARLSEGMAALRAAGCGALTLLPLWPRAGTAAKRVILSGRRGARGPDRLLPGLVLHAGSGWTAEAEAVLRDAAALAP
ncbi:MAG: N-6 DNA methylase [Acetobacteraceae bacterium]|nr:N-6 DNA methylase [Acetobacteraceae bacterium]